MGGRLFWNGGNDTPLHTMKDDDGIVLMLSFWCFVLSLKNWLFL